MAITSRPAALTTQLASLEAQQAATSPPDEWVAAQIDDIKQKLAQLTEQDNIWDTEHALRSHNYVGLVSMSSPSEPRNIFGEGPVT